MFYIFLLVYAGWAVYSGLRVMKGRIAWCEEPGLPNKVVKVILSFLIGSVIGAFYLIFIVVGFFIGQMITSNRSVKRK